MPVQRVWGGVQHHFLFVFVCHEIANVSFVSTRGEGIWEMDELSHSYSDVTVRLQGLDVGRETGKLEIAFRPGLQKR